MFRGSSSKVRIKKDKSKKNSHVATEEVLKLELCLEKLITLFKKGLEKYHGVNKIIIIIKKDIKDLNGILKLLHDKKTEFAKLIQAQTVTFQNKSKEPTVLGKLFSLLSYFPFLTYLELQNTGITDADVKKLSDNLLVCKAIREVNLSNNNQLTAACLTALIEILPKEGAVKFTLEKRLSNRTITVYQLKNKKQQTGAGKKLDIVIPKEMEDEEVNRTIMYLNNTSKETQAKETPIHIEAVDGNVDVNKLIAEVRASYINKEVEFYLIQKIFEYRLTYTDFNGVTSVFKISEHNDPNGEIRTNLETYLKNKPIGDVTTVSLFEAGLQRLLPSQISNNSMKTCFTLQDVSMIGNTCAQGYHNELMTQLRNYLNNNRILIDAIFNAIENSKNPRSEIAILTQCFGSINVRRPITGETLLHMAVKSKNPTALIAALIEANINPSLVNERGKLPVAVEQKTIKTRIEQYMQQFREGTSSVSVSSESSPKVIKAPVSSLSLSLSQRSTISSGSIRQKPSPSRRPEHSASRPQTPRLSNSRRSLSSRKESTGSEREFEGVRSHVGSSRGFFSPFPDQESTTHKPSQSFSSTLSTATASSESTPRRGKEGKGKYHTISPGRQKRRSVRLSASVLHSLIGKGKQPATVADNVETMSSTTPTATSNKGSSLKI